MRTFSFAIKQCLAGALTLLQGLTIALFFASIRVGAYGHFAPARTAALAVAVALLVAVLFFLRTRFTSHRLVFALLLLAHVLLSAYLLPAGPSCTVEHHRFTMLPRLVLTSRAVFSCSNAVCVAAFFSYVHGTVLKGPIYSDVHGLFALLGRFLPFIALEALQSLRLSVYVVLAFILVYFGTVQHALWLVSAVAPFTLASSSFAGFVAYAMRACVCNVVFALVLSILNFTLAYNASVVHENAEELADSMERAGRDAPLELSAHSLAQALSDGSVFDVHAFRFIVHQACISPSPRAAPPARALSRYIMAEFNRFIEILEEMDGAAESYGNGMYLSVPQAKSGHLRRVASYSLTDIAVGYARYRYAMLMWPYRYMEAYAGVLCIISYMVQLQRRDFKLASHLGNAGPNAPVMIRRIYALVAAVEKKCDMNLQSALLKQYLAVLVEN
ncbi:hypothetical protein PAPHI01_0864 [Pancytospora philotis]|nr:hypothetical protein PAPHI01_0864 [Pancytospora philotis]